MSFKEINIRSQQPDAAITEIMYEIAAQRADGVELIRFNLLPSDSLDSGVQTKKIYTALIRTLKAMKQRGSIQFIATEESFSALDTESKFLLNKYPTLFSNNPVSRNGESFIFVKI